MKLIIKIEGNRRDGFSFAVDQKTAAASEEGDLRYIIGELKKTILRENTEIGSAGTE